MQFLEGELNTIKANLAKERQIYFQGIEENAAIKKRCEENKQKYRDMIAVCKPITFGKKNGKP